MAISDRTYLPKNESTLSFPEFLPARKKPVYSICSFLIYSQFWSPVTRLATPIFDNAHPKKIWSAFNFCESVSTYKKSGYFIYFF